MFNGKCNDCGEKVFVNTLASGTMGNKYIPSVSYCTCSDRDTNKDKKIAGLVEYKKAKI